MKFDKKVYDGTSVWFKVLHKYRPGNRKQHETTKEKKLKHGTALRGQAVVSIMKTLLCPEHTKCQWCEELVERARSNATADIEMFY